MEADLTPSREKDKGAHHKGAIMGPPQNNEGTLRTGQWSLHPTRLRQPHADGRQDLTARCGKGAPGAPPACSWPSPQTMPVLSVNLRLAETYRESPRVLLARSIVEIFRTREQFEKFFVDGLNYFVDSDLV